MIEEKRYAYQPRKHFCLIACVTAWYLSSFFIHLWPEVLPLGLFMLFFMESWSCICDLLQVIIPSLMYSEIFQTWLPRNPTGWKGSLTQKIQIGRHQCDLTWLKFRSEARSCHSAVLPTHQAHQSRFHGLKVKEWFLVELMLTVLSSGFGPETQTSKPTLCSQ